jgi:hypothetical protein
MRLGHDAGGSLCGFGFLDAPEGSLGIGEFRMSGGEHTRREVQDLVDCM